MIFFRGGVRKSKTFYSLRSLRDFSFYTILTKLNCIKRKTSSAITEKVFNFVGMRRFELPAPGPPDQYSNLAELHPDQYYQFLNLAEPACLRQATSRLINISCCLAYTFMHFCYNICPNTCLTYIRNGL